jgi:hypothetical protein
MLGALPLKQHVVEFIIGTGVVTDGVVDATSTTGPWSWHVPDGVCELTFDGVAGGRGGQGGASVASMVSAGGGCGGGSGAALFGQVFKVRPSSTLTITLGAGGTGGSMNADGVNGGHTTVSGLLPGHCVWAEAAGSVVMRGSNSYQGPSPTASTTSATLGGGGPDMADPGSDGNSWAYLMTLMIGVSPVSGNGGTGGGGKVGESGGSGQEAIASYDNTFFNLVHVDGSSRSGAGTFTGGVSRGGGGPGLMSEFGLGGIGGTGAAGGDAPIYGAGGGGGAGGFVGGKGGDGYVRFTYWSAT